MTFLRALLFICLLATGQWCLADAGLKAYVVLNEQDGSPAARVQFSADGQNQISLSDGSFAMHFVQRKPGDVVPLVMQRPGWGVVNRHVLDHTLLASPESRTLQIIIAKESEREQKALVYYRLKGNQVVDQQVQLKLAELTGRNAATAEELARLRQERDQARQQIEELAQKLAASKPGETSDIDRLALKFFLDGQLDEALALLSEARLDEDAAKAQAKLQQNVNSWQLRAKMLAVKFDFAGAFRAYQKTAELLPGNGDVWFQYARFHQSQNQWVQARQGYERALGLYRFNGEQAKIARALNNLGVLHRDENRKIEARAAHEESLRIRRALALKSPDVYLPAVATSLNNLGVLHNEENRNTDARAAHEEALKIRRALALTKREVYLPAVADSLNNLGIVHSDENRTIEAHAAYEESLTIYRALAPKNPDVYLPAVANSLNNLGVLHSDENRNTEALAAYEESLKIRRTLALTNPDVYLPVVATSLNNLGNLHRQENRSAEAHVVHEESLKIRRVLALTNPDVYLPAVATSLNNLGNLYHQENRDTEASAAYEESLKIRRALALTNPDAYLPAVATSLNNLGNLHRRENRNTEARSAFSEALEIYKQFVQRSEGYRTSLNTVQRNLDDLEK